MIYLFVSLPISRLYVLYIESASFLCQPFIILISVSIQWRFYVGARGFRSPKSCPGAQFLIGSIIISLSLVASQMMRGQAVKYFFLEPPLCFHSHVLCYHSRGGPQRAKNVTRAPPAIRQPADAAAYAALSGGWTSWPPS